MWTPGHQARTPLSFNELPLETCHEILNKNTLMNQRGSKNNEPPKGKGSENFSLHQTPCPLCKFTTSPAVTSSDGERYWEGQPHPVLSHPDLWANECLLDFLCMARWGPSSNSSSKQRKSANLPLGLHRQSCSQ